MRDETTANWLQEFLDHNGLHDLHACDAFRVSTCEYLTALFGAPLETITVHKPIPGRTTNPNPYLKKRYLTYDVDITPRTLAMRVLVCRLFFY